MFDSAQLSAAGVLQLGPERHGGVVRVVQPALRQHHATGGALPPPRALGVGWERQIGVEGSEQFLAGIDLILAGIRSDR